MGPDVDDNTLTWWAKQPDIREKISHPRAELVLKNQQNPLINGL